MSNLTADIVLLLETGKRDINYADISGGRLFPRRTWKTIDILMMMPSFR